MRDDVIGLNPPSQAHEGVVLAEFGHFLLIRVDDVEFGTRGAQPLTQAGGRIGRVGLQNKNSHTRHDDDAMPDGPENAAAPDALHHIEFRTLPSWDERAVRPPKARR